MACLQPDVGRARLDCGQLPSWGSHGVGEQVLGQGEGDAAGGHAAAGGAAQARKLICSIFGLALSQGVSPHLYYHRPPPHIGVPALNDGVPEICLSPGTLPTPQTVLDLFCDCCQRPWTVGSLQMVCRDWQVWEQETKWEVFAVCIGLQSQRNQLLRPDTSPFFGLCFGLWGHTQWCLGFTPSSALGIHSWWCLGEHLGCWD